MMILPLGRRAKRRPLLTVSAFDTGQSTETKAIISLSLS
jgi:hypothetical protein